MTHEATDFQTRIGRTDRARRLGALFPGKTCGAEDCETQCAEALKIARKLNLEPVPFVQNFIVDKIAPEYGCSIPADCAAEILENMRCRFGFVRPETAVPFDDTEFGLESASIKIYTFDSTNEKCKKCEPLENTRVTQQQWEDEEEMKRLGFWKQKDGVYRPHPHCKCVWKETTVNFADYEWKKMNNDELATYQLTVPVPLRLALPPQILQEKLAAMTKLDPSEFLMWGKNIVCKRDKDAFTTTFSVNVPNIWICANLLQGVGKWQDPIINIGGGWVGEKYSAITVQDKHQIFCHSVSDFMESFGKYRGKIWGFVLYVHGNSLGTIAPPGKNVLRTTQSALLSQVDSQGYKFAKISLMQCNSGANGKFDVTVTYGDIKDVWKAEIDEENDPHKKEKMQLDYWHHKLSYPAYMVIAGEFPKYEAYYKNMAKERSKGLEYLGGEYDENKMVFHFRAKWGAEWKKRVADGNPFIYQGANVVGIDMNPITREVIPDDEEEKKK